MKLSSFKQALVGALVATGVSVMADTEPVQTLTFGSANNPVDIGAADMPTLQFSKFDSTLGTLDDVLITLTANNSLESLAVNLGKATTYQGLSAAATVSISGPDGVKESTALTVGPTSGSIVAGSYSAPVTITPAFATKSTTTQFSPTDLSTYEASGGGTLNFLLNAALSDVSNPGSGVPLLIYGYDAFSYGSVSIQYDYTPLVAVPESGTMMAGLFALGIGFIAACRSRVRYQ